MGLDLVVGVGMTGIALLGALAIYLPACYLADRRHKLDHRMAPAVVRAAGPASSTPPRVLPRPNFAEPDFVDAAAFDPATQEIPTSIMATAATVRMPVMNIR